MSPRSIPALPLLVCFPRHAIDQSFVEPPVSVSVDAKLAGSYGVAGLPAKFKHASPLLSVPQETVPSRVRLYVPATRSADVLPDPSSIAQQATRPVASPWESLVLIAVPETGFDIAYLFSPSISTDS